MALGPNRLAVLVLVVCAAGAGLLWGRASVPPSESVMISLIAGQYEAETGGQARDCYARPGPAAGVWLTVYCDGAAGRFAYPLDRSGRPVDFQGDGT